jgi:hypothetical protein
MPDETKLIVELRLEDLTIAFRKFFRNVNTADLLNEGERDSVKNALCVIGQLIAFAKVRDSLKKED